MCIARKPISAILALLLSISLCVACGPGGSSPDLPPSGETSASLGSNVNRDSEVPETTVSNTEEGQTEDPDFTTPEQPPSSPLTTVSPTVPVVPAPSETPPISTEPSPPTTNEPTAPVTSAPIIDSSPSPSPSEAPPTSGEPDDAPVTTEPDDSPVVLTISGDGVSSETTWTLGQLQAMRDGYREVIYSTTNNYPTFSHSEAHGISLTYLLRQAGILSSAASIRLIASDGYRSTLTYNQVFGTLYSYSTHNSSGSSGASPVEPLLAWEYGSVGSVRLENIRSFFGQSGPMEVNTASFVSDLILIEVSTASAGSWAAPNASISDEGSVHAGTELELLHENRDSIRIYYTLDGSEPDYSSLVYNRSTSYFQPHLIVPIVLTESVTIKAFAAGLGRDPSPVAVFTYIIS